VRDDTLRLLFSIGVLPVVDRTEYEEKRKLIGR
jgi:hypothetical protein